ncbi:prepilin-type N-terminal cleavage/methylation domain-containing protein [Alkalibaculum sp. M08DMB]|uniref:Prepilin-type N-terminal cleavage/methylation domain-containing protein n=1 Tax=Alkalibaculum sporogenes TaxID=2655001 RepID=A0A6A7K6U0_9FIRM|nr:type II secretion system protein [Alkalibaculum sporogenes]MPW25124.1 prepilin-type N-terminal cleavage/methylation domain-containing protein [Alkalibaculum sporogenes]
MKRNKGFTLVEIVVALAIFSLLICITFISSDTLRNFVQRQNLKTQSREVLQALLVGKNNAVIDGYTRKIIIYKDKIYIQTIKETIETEKIEFRDSIFITSNTYNAKRLELRPIGTVNLGGHFTFENQMGDKMTIVVQIASGRIYLKEGS